MIEKFLNIIGLYTKQQIIDFLLNESQRQAEAFKAVYRSEYEQMSTNCENSLNGLVKKYPLGKDIQYQLITPFFDSAHNFHWIIVQVPKCVKQSNFGRIEVKDRFNSYDHEGFLDYCIYKKIDDIKPSRIEIVDFIIGPKRQGIGSYLLILLDNIAQMLGTAYIYGSLSPVDFGNREEQVKFYSRSGYTISFLDKSRKEGAILKKYPFL